MSGLQKGWRRVGEKSRTAAQVKSILRGDILAPQFHNEPKLSLSQERSDDPNDPEFPADLYPLADLEGVLLCEVTR
jgi:hypothetical protein